VFVLRLAEELRDRKVDFVLVGGVAMALQGVVRATMDVDLVLRLDEGQFTRFEEVMKQLGLQSRLPVVAKEVFHFRKEYLEKRNLRAWSFVNPKNPAELVDVLIDRDSKDLDFDVISVAGQKIKVASKEELIRMKKEAGRPQDLVDIENLKAQLKG
jgi:predicted nucleotidyltransferase